MKITILGGGAMATACSVLLAEQPEHSVSIWARNPDYAAQMQQHRENKRLLPGITLPTAVTITSDIAAAVADTDMIVVSVPTAFLRAALTEHRDSLTVPVPIVSVLK